jgi:beta-N-acetylhexosaminidase
VTSACILGCSGLELTPEERALFRDARPWGFILFKRNVGDPDQVRALVQSFRDCVGRPDAPVLIDQEGGRVQRLGPPHWRRYPTARAYGLAGGGDPMRRRELARLGGRLLAHDLKALGITVDCAPVLDTPQPGAHDVIGDRAYGQDWETVAELGRAVCEGLLAGGVLPVIKHAPGHGRAGADSHLDLPVVDAPYEALERADFRPFRACSDMPMAMTAHVVYAAIDEAHPATTSPEVIRLIREALGFDGLLLSDDLSMKALCGAFEDRARQALHAGCDVVLHCNGDMDEMRAVLRGCGELAGEPLRRARVALHRIVREVEPLDEASARTRFAEAFPETAPPETPLETATS